MAFLDVKMQQEPQKFDWDNFRVGNHLLDNSQNFFGRYLEAIMIYKYGIPLEHIGKMLKISR